MNENLKLILGLGEPLEKLGGLYEDNQPISANKQELMRHFQDAINAGLTPAQAAAHYKLGIPLPGAEMETPRPDPEPSYSGPMSRGSGGLMPSSFNSFMPSDLPSPQPAVRPVAKPQPQPQAQVSQPQAPSRKPLSIDQSKVSNREYRELMPMLQGEAQRERSSQAQSGKEDLRRWIEEYRGALKRRGQDLNDEQKRTFLEFTGRKWDEGLDEKEREFNETLAFWREKLRTNKDQFAKKLEAYHGASDLAARVRAASDLLALEDDYTRVITELPKAIGYGMESSGLRELVNEAVEGKKAFRKRPEVGEAEQILRQVAGGKAGNGNSQSSVKVETAGGSEGGSVGAGKKIVGGSERLRRLFGMTE